MGSIVPLLWVHIYRSTIVYGLQIPIVYGTIYIGAHSLGGPTYQHTWTPLGSIVPMDLGPMGSRVPCVLVLRNMESLGILVRRYMGSGSSWYCGPRHSGSSWYSGPGDSGPWYPGSMGRPGMTELGTLELWSTGGGTMVHGTTRSSGTMEPSGTRSSGTMEPELWYNGVGELQDCGYSHATQ